MKAAASIPFPARRRRVRAFTLAELLTVIAILIFLFAFLTPAIGPLLNSSSINTAGSMVVDEFNLARQVALARNRNVEVRFYRLESESGDDRQFRAFRSFLTDGDDPAKAEPLSKVRYLPRAVIFAPQTNFSPLLNGGSPGLITGQEALPQATSATPYVGFLFRSSGGTSLSPPDELWYVTLHGETAPKTAATGLPSNYFTIQVDPVTGRVRSYHP